MNTVSGVQRERLGLAIPPPTIFFLVSLSVSTQFLLSLSLSRSFSLSLTHTCSIFFLLFYFLLSQFLSLLISFALSFSVLLSLLSSIFLFFSLSLSLYIYIYITILSLTMTLSLSLFLSPPTHYDHIAACPIKAFLQTEWLIHYIDFSCSHYQSKTEDEHYELVDRGLSLSGRVFSIWLVGFETRGQCYKTFFSCEWHSGLKKARTFLFLSRFLSLANI